MFTTLLCAIALQPLGGPVPTPTQGNDVKGQGQLVGINGDFGAIYSLKNGFNVAILSARYTVEPFDCYALPVLQGDQKFVVLDIAVKNAKPEDNFLDTSGFIKVIDTTGKIYDSTNYRLESKGAEAPDTTLRPGQGLGQKELKDPFRVAFPVDAKAVINKIMINQGRLNTNEQVVRFMMSEPPKPDATTKPKNFIAALPDGVRESGDAWGAIAMAEGKGAIGVSVPSGAFGLKLESLAASDAAKFNGEPPAEGKKFWVATFVVTGLVTQNLTMYEVTGGDQPSFELSDADGERYKPLGYRKAKADEEPEHEFRKGDQYTFRVLFEVPADAKFKKFVYGTWNSQKWAVHLN
ncbi:MAG: hypothetical protein HZC36_12560 [Armatimonadetes bacterium]|nr:hypothetical protein [Armatimonadota bacterium]